MKLPQKNDMFLHVVFGCLFFIQNTYIIQYIDKIMFDVKSDDLILYGIINSKNKNL